MVIPVCDEYGVKKQTVSDIRRSKNKLTSYAMKFDVAPSEDRNGAFHKTGMVPFISESILEFQKVECWRKRFISGTCNSVQ